MELWIFGDLDNFGNPRKDICQVPIIEEPGLEVHHNLLGAQQQKHMNEVTEKHGFKLPPLIWAMPVEMFS